MLKRKLIRKGLIWNSALIMLVLLTTSGAPRPVVVVKQPLVADSSLQWLRFDTDLQQLVAVTELEAMEMPSILLNKKGVKFVNDYLARNNSKLETIRNRSERSFNIIDKIFRKYNLPVELKYLAVVESELKTTARSRVGARGPWQLMPVTARLLQLKVNGQVDERTHLSKSTVAAAKYLRDLHAQFGDWLLVIAAYNAGPAPVLKAIKKSGSRDFWKLQQYLPAETRGHVKKYISTHYFFEGQGSLTTLTKEETAVYQHAVAELLARQVSQPVETAVEIESAEPVAAFK